MNQLFIDGMAGIGDNINQRAFIKALAAQGNEIWLRTPLPEIYAGIPHLHFVRTNTKLRTQRKNEQRTKIQFEPLPFSAFKRKRIFYGNQHLKAGSVFDAMEEQFGIAPAAMDLPRFNLPDIGLPAGKSIAVVRPTIERREWHNASRGPLNTYVDQVARMLAARGYYVVSIADCEQDQEWIPDVEPFAHKKLHHGELSITQMLALVERADIVVTGACVIFHAAMAYGKPMICIQGGNGGNNHHTKITDPRCSDLSRALFVYPDNYCHCQEMLHPCDKRISNLAEQVTPFINNLAAAKEVAA